MASSTFTLAADPDTDIWKKPPSHDVFTAPYRTLAKRPTRSFVSASLTFSAPYAHQFDQAGLLLIFARPSAPGTPRKWLKAGVELFDGLPRLSTVACDAWSDWSVAPVGGGGASAGHHVDPPRRAARRRRGARPRAHARAVLALWRGRGRRLGARDCGGRGAALQGRRGQARGHVSGLQGRVE
ncbi:hypothetical protein HIM_09239 [Hirsutella minnesotensis 3608]|uniref:Uncharacterized protein n=1 Tax=Hirsutella minnesotensis 3608 TaxID=1043627 RepID=A0A0F7ZGR6_9HYPO|nr:hypothetical protein HIM_09239 [Hirsutella minnesotensis 3608]